MPIQYRKYLSCVKRLNNIFNFKTKIFFNTHIYFWVLIIFFSLLKLFLLSGQHLFAIGYMKHDDSLFVNTAYNLISLKWLGNYNNLTLAKGPGYPIWIAFNYLLGIPLLLSQNLLYILACIVLIISLKPLFLKNYFWLIIIYLVVLFNPSSFSEQSVRVLREGIYPALTLFIMAFSIGIFVRKNEIINKLYVWVLGLSIVLPFFWLTREEGVWIMPFLVSIILFTGFNIWKIKGEKWKGRLKLLIIPFVALFLSILIFSSINYFKYGIFSTVEFNNASFLKAYGSLTRVKDEEWKRYLPVSRKKMNMIYEVSPSFRELQPSFDGENGKMWVEISSILKLNSPNEIGGGWFMWAFRDAVEAAGYYKDGNSAQNFYKQLFEEINIACEQKKLDCFGKRSTMLDPFYKEQINPTLQSTFDTVMYLISFNGTEISNITSSLGDKYSLDLFSKITHEPVYIDDIIVNQNVVQKSAFNKIDDIKLSILNNIGKLYRFSMLWLSILALSIFILSTFVPNVRNNSLYLINLCILFSVFARIAILSIINATSFKILFINYFSPLHSMVLVFILLNLFLFKSVIAKKFSMI